jgi:microcin C transport system substrate-binding protein
MTWWNKPDVDKPEPEPLEDKPATETDTSVTRTTEQ